MTRINIVPVSELTRQHLVAEYRELPRVFSLVRAGQFHTNWKIPSEYLLGTGHVTFFYDKLGWLSNRYKELVDEMVNRGYSPNPIPCGELTAGIVNRYLGDYTPTAEAMQINRERIAADLAVVKTELHGWVTKLHLADGRCIDLLDPTCDDGIYPTGSGDDSGYNPQLNPAFEMVDFLGNKWQSDLTHFD